ncbi:MAG: UDP-N-acetylmuramoyl-tripeptide--D-alanyl-D-alanine ligase [Flavobacteriaceae bacterium]|nr:UDP-N-acetylmuramoyl-tripeptide--D-alanyl-D-alanine ligase [Flavobacteriaceae bacterium]
MNTNQLYDLFLKCNGVSTDTRSIKKNSLFFSLKGENFDGNDYALEALNKGAKYAVIDNNKLKNSKFIQVNDVLTSLQLLSACHRTKLKNTTIIALTGSNGKTTTKELIHSVLSEKYKTVSTLGNLNNHIGVPLTLLKLTYLHEIAIVEMGASKQGDIKELAEIAEPTHGLITNIGKAHLEGFGSFENIIKTKFELYDFIHSSKGEIFVNNEDNLLKNEIDPTIIVHSYGQKNSNVKGFIAVHHPTVSLKWSINNFEHQTKTKLIGGYNLNNILCAICIGSHFNVSENKIHSAIENYTPSNHRSQIVNTKRNAIIADCYNANPSSVMESLKSFKSINKNNKLAILGDMLELGSVSYEEHLKIISYLQTQDVDAILVGEEFSKLKSNYPTFQNTNDAITFLSKKDFKNFTILLKGSRGIKLEKIIDTTIF